MIRLLHSRAWPMAARGMLVALALALVPDVSRAQAVSDSLSPARIVVGPEVLVSRDGDVPHVETTIAANPRSWSNLLGAAIVGGRAGGGTRCKAYTSHDGGQSWVDWRFPELERWPSFDPQVAFTPRGTAIFTCLSLAPDATGTTRGYLYVWRSEDGGLTWSATPANLGVSYDHEQLAVDHTMGRFAGRIYLSALNGRGFRLGLFRSEDDGRTWTGPVEFTNGGDHGVNVQQLAIFSDGALLVTWADFPLGPKQRQTWKESNYWTALSTDGGITFSAPRKVIGATMTMTMAMRIDRLNPEGRFRTDPHFAVDPSERHRDRLYMVWTALTADGPRIMLVRSDDRGASWSAPMLVDPSAPNGTEQHQPHLAVNGEGTVGIAYFDSRAVADGGWHEYFTASIDGGDTFLPPVRVSSEPARPDAAGNLRVEPMAVGNGAESGMRGRISLYLTSGASRWPTGGDYLGMAVDSLGQFHPLWPDARTGTYQLWTARIRVARPSQPRPPHPYDEYSPPPAPAPPLVPPAGAPVDVSSRVELTFDPTVELATTGELELRVRIKNVSTDSIFGPLRLEVRGFGTPLQTDAAKYAPIIVTAANGKAGVGAVVDFTPVLGTERVIPPGGQTGAAVLRLRLVDKRRTPSLNIGVTGVLRSGR